jgi:ABC-type branched-subunit amino acid transport system permease subunit
VRYFVHAVDGQIYGPYDLNAINQWIAEGRIVPTTVLQPEGSNLRVAASTVQGLVWIQGQNFNTYTPQRINNGNLEHRSAWVCFFASLVLCCLPQGFHIAAGVVGMVLSVIAFRKGHTLAALALILNLVLTVMYVREQSIFDSVPGINRLNFDRRGVPIN